jgi:hypothetical protein
MYFNHIGSFTGEGQTDLLLLNLSAENSLFENCPGGEEKIVGGSLSRQHNLEKRNIEVVFLM